MGQDLGLQLDDAALERYGANEAKLLDIRGRVGARALRRRMNKNLNVIDAISARVAGWCRDNQSIPQSFEWLLDNRYLLEREGKQALMALRGAGKLPFDRASGRPAACGAMRSFVRVTRGEVTLQRLQMFLKGFQSERVMTERELSLLIPLLKAALLEMAASVCLEMREVLDGFRLDPRVSPYAAERAVLLAISQGSAPPPGAEELAARAREKHAAQSARLGSAVTALRMLSSADADSLLQEASAVERILRDDPSGHYKAMSDESRAAYRQALCKLSKRGGVSEQNAAAQAVALASEQPCGPKRHVGYFIFNRPLGHPPADFAGRLYFSCMIVLTELGAAAVWALTGRWWAALLSVLPVWDAAKYLCDYAAMRLKPPAHIPRLELREGIPGEGRALCVITAVLSKPEQAIELARRLEQYRLCNRDAGANAAYGLLYDLPDKRHAVEPGDEELERAALHELSALNHKYGGFYLFSRERVFSEGEGRYMGWERKRGALNELFRSLRGKPSGIRVRVGDPAALAGTQYVVTLDADTQLSAGTLRPLIGAMLHPLNRPAIDPARRVVSDGFGILQPRMAVELNAANVSWFTRLYAGQGGLDPYCGSVSDVYQDVFGRGAFVGKGVVSVDAFLECLDGRLPEGRVLSHDLLEGAYLRAGLIGDIEWADGYPAHVTAWLERANRWIRGDWQIAAWLRRQAPAPGGQREPNPLDGLSRYQMFDNLRRSVTPPVNLLILALFALSLPHLAWPALTVLLDMGCHLLITAGQLAARYERGVRRCRSTAVTGVRGAAYQLIAQLWLLPMQAYSALKAVWLAFWRLCVTHRKLLHWRTAAAADADAATEGHSGFWRGAAAYYERYWLPALTGAAVLFLSGGPAGRCLGVLWLTAPFFAALISARERKRAAVNESERAYLRQHAAVIWRYFEDFVTAADHYLPPDNWQEQPGAGLARRTSPTNIGLALLSALAALDMNLIDSERALQFIDKTVTATERLTKWYGHLYNWYDTATAQPLRPACISTVDSGNLAGCLLALREGLSELRDAAAEDLAARVQSLYEAMDFRPLYDGKRRLFYIGYDLELDRPTDSYYDLLASEARQTSYIAIARGQVPRNHWRRLGRVQAALDGRSGMASWTGTMFEYFMPHLLMPCPKHSLLYESVRFAAYCQRRRGEDHETPWGISESCFFAFDGALNYQYKAHGIPRLAYKRGLGQELVVSPYSTFLALPLMPKAAMENLKRLQRMGLEGRYGLFEAADFTPSRLSANRSFMAVKCFMSHHLGMSLLSIDNVLCENVMQARFMRDPEMGAYHELLEEKAPAGGVVMKPRGQEVPEKPARGVVTGWRREFEDIDVFEPHCTLMSNAAYTLLCTDAGLTASHSSGVELTRFEPDPFKTGLGWQFFISSGGVRTGLTAAPMMSAHARYSAAFDINEARWDMRDEQQGLHTFITAGVPRDERGELRSVTLTNTGKVPARLDLYAYLEPVLASRAEYESHPAFSKLFLQCFRTGQNIRVTRRPRGGGGEIHLVVSCDALDSEAETSRERALPRGGSLFRALPLPPPLPMSPGQSDYTAAGSGKAWDSGVEPDSCVMFRVPVRIDPGASRVVRFSMAAAATAADAEAAAVRILRLGDDAETAGADGAMRLLGLSPAEAHGAMDWLTDLNFITHNRARQSFDAEHNTKGRDALWQWGISGDLPIVTVTGPDTQPERLARLLRQYRFLSLMGARFDFVIHTRDGGDYRRPQRAYIMETLKAMGCENILGARGGVYVVDALSSPPEDTRLLLTASSLVLDGQKPERRKTADKPAFKAPEPKSGGAVRQMTARPVKTRWTEEGFSFEVDGRMPEAAWGHTLANAAFGCLMKDAGCGHIWRMNARENKFTPWDNDPRALQSGETLSLNIDGHEVSPFADDNEPCEVTYGFGFARYIKSVGGNKTVTTTVLVPPDRMARVMLLEVEGASSATLRHCAELVMGTAREARRYVVTAWDAENGCLTARNPYNTAYHPQTAVYCSHPRPLSHTCDFTAWREGRLGGQTGAALDPCFGAVIPLMPRDGRLTAVVVVGAAGNAPGIRRVCELADHELARAELARVKAWWLERVRPVKIRTPSPALNHYINGWALYQVIATRLFARASLYQCGGAYGFRDQLQDVCATLYADPRLARTQVIRACAHQFEEGDVQHWWHPAKRGRGFSDKGVRTRCSDDLLWLPYTVCEYVEKTGDMGLLDLSVPYIAAPPLEDGRHDRFDTPRASELSEAVFCHCVRALDLVLARGAGKRGLLLIGGGDWNDGFDKVGAEGRGESTWLTWFASHVLARFAALCRQREPDGGMDMLAGRYRDAARELARAADCAWDGGWYLRGTYDDGSPLGGRDSGACQIDSIAQSFSPLCPEASPERVAKAVDSAWERLVDTGNRLARLYTPPFDRGPEEPGYIKGYLPGVRENGGQYTHAAIWLAMAQFLRGRPDRGLELMELLLPENHDNEIYKAEPHVLAADVYTCEGHVGRGGWSHYTGAAAWYYRVAMEYLLGVRLRGGEYLAPEPGRPPQWDGKHVGVEVENKKRGLLTHGV